ncbi:MAG: HAMP domain-containing protein, partial [Armatimonadota bacterium]
MRRISQLAGFNIDIHSMQVFDINNWTQISAFGDERGWMSLPVSNINEGVLPKVNYNSFSVLRGAKSASVGGNARIYVFSTIIPDDFSKATDLLTRTLSINRQWEEYRRQFWFVLIVFYSYFSFPLILLGILIGFQMSNEIIKPIVDLEAATKRVADGDYSYRLLGRARYDMRHLTESFNSMMSELERSRDQIKQTEKMSAWQDIAQRLAHEIRNPLTPIKLSAQRVLTKYDGQDEQFQKILQNSVSVIVQEVDNLNVLLQEFRNFSKLPHTEKKSVKIADIIKNVLDTYHETYATSEVDTQN